MDAGLPKVVGGALAAQTLKLWPYSLKLSVASRSRQLANTMQQNKSPRCREARGLKHFWTAFITLLCGKLLPSLFEIRIGAN
jgi:hypothetical protein